jgi:hypothetical protein
LDLHRYPTSYDCRARRRELTPLWVGSNTNGAGENERIYSLNMQRACDSAPKIWDFTPNWLFDL